MQPALKHLHAWEVYRGINLLKYISWLVNNQYASYFVDSHGTMMKAKFSSIKCRANNLPRAIVFGLNLWVIYQIVSIFSLNYPARTICPSMQGLTTSQAEVWAWIKTWMLAPAAVACNGATGSIMGRSATKIGVGFGVALWPQARPASDGQHSYHHLM